MADDAGHTLIRQNVLASLLMALQENLKGGVEGVLKTVPPARHPHFRKVEGRECLSLVFSIESNVQRFLCG